MINSIEEMPEFQPREIRVAPGVERVPVDAKTRSIVDAFSVVEQQIQWLARQYGNAQRFTLDLQNTITGLNNTMTGLNKTVLDLQTSLSDIRNTPQKLFWKYALRAVGIASTAYITYLVTRHAGK